MRNLSGSLFLVRTNVAVALAHLSYVDIVRSVVFDQVRQGALTMHMHWTRRIGTDGQQTARLSIGRETVLHTGAPYRGGNGAVASHAVDRYDIDIG